MAYSSEYPAKPGDHYDSFNRKNPAICQLRGNI